MLKLSANHSPSPRNFILFLLYIFYFLLILSSGYSKARPTALPPEQAFPLTITQAGEKTLRVEFSLPEGYYLYRDKLSFSSSPPNRLGKITFNSPIQFHQDDFFGRQAIFRHETTIYLSLMSNQLPFTLSVISQGCADLGVCYPPLQRNYKVTASGIIKENNFSPSPLATSTQANSGFKLEPIYSSHPSKPIENSNLFHLVKTLMFFLLAGIAMSLTACMYPLIPIVSSVIVHHHGKGKNAFWSAFMYAQGIALTYMIFGVLAGMSGTLLNVYLQQAIFIIPISLLIIILALAMLDVFHLQLPSRWQNALQHISFHSPYRVLTLLLMGAISALIVGPCIAPPLAFALGYISSKKNIVLGGASLYSMGLGLSVPFLIFSLFGPRFLPKAGQWMTVIKHLLGVGLLFVAIRLLSPFIPSILVLGLYSVLFLLPIFIFYRYPAITKKGRILYLVIVLFLLFCLVSLHWHYYTRKPSVIDVESMLELPSRASYHQTLEPIRYTNPTALLSRIKEELEQHPSLPIYLDFYAQWCSSCREMQSSTFSNIQVQEHLKQGLFLQMDLTQNTREQRNLMKMFHVYAPPAFFIIKAPNHYTQPLLGKKDPKDFLLWLEHTQQDF